MNFQNLPGCDFHLKFAYFPWHIMKRSIYIYSSFFAEIPKPIMK
nr:MAG TPA: hypothetical protein [Caudoviricetes sp.]